MKSSTIRVRRDYKNCSKPKLMSRGNNVFGSMNGNAIFPSAPVKMEYLKQGLDNLEAAMIDAQHGDRLKSSLKNAAGIKLVEMLDQLADYVESVANGDDAIILSAGFAVSYRTGNKSTIGPIENFVVENGPTSGEMTLSLTRTVGAISYSFYYGIDDGDKTIWIDVPSSKISVVISDLQPGKTYLFKVAALGSRNKRCQSEIIRKVVF